MCREGCSSMREGSHWGLCSLGGELSSWWCWSWGLCDRGLTEGWTAGGWRGAQSLGDGTPGKELTDWPQKTFLSLPTYMCRLFTTLPAYCSTALIRRFCSNFVVVAHSQLFVFQLVLGCFPATIRSTLRCAFTPPLKVIVTPGLKSKQPCLSPWAASCN